MLLDDMMMMIIIIISTPSQLTNTTHIQNSYASSQSYKCKCCQSHYEDENTEALKVYVTFRLTN